MPEGIEQGFAMVRAKLDGFIDPPPRRCAAGRRRTPRPPRAMPARSRPSAPAARPRPVAALDVLIREQPSNPYLHELKGQVLFESGQVAEAVAPYAQAARLAPEEGLIRLNLARR
jgi:predicted Zn-dependent protease